MAPQLAAHADAITLDAELFARIDALFDRPHELELDPESLRLLEHRHRDAVRAGARLGAAEQDRLRALNTELSELSTEFGRLLLAEANDSAPCRHRRRAAGRAGPGRGLGRGPGRGRPRAGRLSDHPRAAHGAAGLAVAHRPRPARAAAHGVGLPGLARQRNDARGLVRRIAPCAPNGPGCSGTRTTRPGWWRSAPPAASRRWTPMLHKLAPRAAANARAEADELAAAAGHPIEPWDRAFYAERVRREPASTSTPRPCVPTSSWTGCCTTGSSTPPACSTGCASPSATTCPATTPTCASSTCYDDDGQLGLFVADLYARDSKRGGAWMNSSSASRTCSAPGRWC